MSTRVFRERTCVVVMHAFVTAQNTHAYTGERDVSRVQAGSICDSVVKLRQQTQRSITERSGKEGKEKAGMDRKMGTKNC